MLPQIFVVLAKFVNTNDMNLADTAQAAHNDDDGPVDLTLWGSGEADEFPNLDRDGSDPEKGIACLDIPFGDCCQGENDELFDSIEHNTAPGWTRLVAHTGPPEDHCQQVITSTDHLDCLSGGRSGFTIHGASVEGSEDDGGDDGGDHGDNAAAEAETTGREVKKKRAVRASHYTYRHPDGFLWYIPINSSLGEAYRKLATGREKSQFIAEHGVPRGCWDNGTLVRVRNNKIIKRGKGDCPLRQQGGQQASTQRN